MSTFAPRLSEVPTLGLVLMTRPWATFSL